MRTLEGLNNPITTHTFSGLNIGTGIQVADVIGNVARESGVNFIVRS